MMSQPDHTWNLSVALTVGAAVAAIGLWAQNAALVGVGYDDAIYALLARAISLGDGYRLTSLPASLPGVKYPPIYPLSLVPFWTLISTQEAALYAMKLANGLYIGAAAGLFAFMLTDLKVLPLGTAAGAALLGFASGSMMLITSTLLAEPLYLVLGFGALWLADRTREEAGYVRLVAVGVLAGLVVLTRVAGIALLAAVLFATWRRGGWRRALVPAGAAAVVVAPWALFALGAANEVPATLVPRYGSYAQLYLLNVAATPILGLEILTTNLAAILRTLGSKSVPQLGGVLLWPSGFLLVALSMLGSRRVFSTAPATALYPWVYLALVSVWSFPPFRFVFVIFPLLLALAAAGFSVVAAWLGTRVKDGTAPLAAFRGPWAKRTAVALGLLLAANLGYREARSLTRRVWDGAQLQKSAVAGEVVDWVKAHTEADAVVAFEFDPLLSLHTGRASVPNNYEPVHFWYRRGSPPLEPLAQLFRDAGVSLVVVRRDVPAAAVPIAALMDRYPEGLRLVDQTPSGALIFTTNLPALADGSSRRDTVPAGAAGSVDVSED